ncbi:MAG TPA: TetR/AcrR family transcriptional regulator [Clostridia bacterium]|nr:TetR/AcrR family transcriptional regulator [Clostridia bacterium]
MKNTKQTIMDAAIKEISEKGYLGATMDGIALNAGVAKGTLYYHFRTKEELFNFIVSEGLALIKQDIDQAVSKETDIIDKFKKLSFVQLKIIYDNRDFFKVIMSQLWGIELRQTELRVAVKDYIAYLESYIKEAMSEKIIDVEDSHLLAYAFFGIMTSVTVYELLNDKEFNSIEDAEKIINYTLNGIGIKNPDS